MITSFAALDKYVRLDACKSLQDFPNPIYRYWNSLRNFSARLMLQPFNFSSARHVFACHSVFTSSSFCHICAILV